MRSFLIICSMLITACACKDIKYKPDIGFIPSAQANSPEFLVKINGSVCKDMDNQVGLCSKRISSDKALSFKMDVRPYAYRLNVECSAVINFSLSRDIPSGQSAEFSIEPSQFSEAKSFTCIGEIFPQDREEEVSAFWHARFLVFDKNYQGREEIYPLGADLILGQNAKYTLLNEQKFLTKKVKTDLKGVQKAYSESESMRFNYYGY